MPEGSASHFKSALGGPNAWTKPGCPALLQCVARPCVEGDMTQNKFIARKEAWQRVSKALLSQLSEHIRPPTQTENELLEEFGPGPIYQPGTRYLGGAGYNPFAEIEQGEAYAAVQDAQRRYRDWKWHCERVDGWLNARDFNGKKLDRAAFDKAFAACFAQPNETASTSEARAKDKPISGGRPVVYDWLALIEPLKSYVSENGKFDTLAALVNWCVDHVTVRAGARRPRGDGPDPKSVKAAISKHGLDEIALRSSEE